MRPTRLFSEFSLITLPMIAGLFVTLVIYDSHPNYRYQESVPLPQVVSSRQNLPLLLTEDGRLAVELFPGIGFHAESLELVTGKKLEIGDRF